MKSNTVFITYNPKNTEEQTLAVRLHTIGAVNGFRMYLPDRYNSESVLDSETKRRIQESNYVILFAMTSKLSTIVKEEIEYAFQNLQDKSKIIVIYNTKKNLKGSITDHFTEIYYNALEETTDEVIERILTTVFKRAKEDWVKEFKDAQLNHQKLEIKKLKEQKESQNALIALLGIGLGLAILTSIAKD